MENDPLEKLFVDKGKTKLSDVVRWKRRVARQIEAQRYNFDPETTNTVEAGWMSTYNEALDMALKIINAK